MLPFSTIDTIREEKNEITTIAAMEKYLKLLGSTTAPVMLKGKASILAVTADNLDTKLRMTIKR